MRTKSTPWKDLCGVNETQLTIQTFNLYTSACVLSESRVDSAYKVAQEENSLPGLRESSMQLLLETFKNHLGFPSG